jgi:hypothetical protein
LTDEEAENIGEEYIKKYFKPIEEENEDSAEEPTPATDENVDEKTPESVDDKIPEEDEEKVEPLSEPNSNE